MFFHYSQNNSGGNFAFDKSSGITHHVVIEADNAKHANERAENIGLYWDGVHEGMDCSCCGDRWYRIWETDKGDKEPLVYGESPDKIKYKWMKPNEEVCIHYLDGTKKWY